MSETTYKKMTYEDYARIPADGNRHEIIEGEWYTTPAPGVWHQRGSRDLGHVLHEHVKRDRLGEVFHAPIDVLLSDEDIVQPDIIFISNSRSSIITDKNIQGAPELVVEILSPSTQAIDRGVKQRLYERAGVREYWIVDTAAKTVEIHEFSSPRRTRVHQHPQTFESALFPGLTIRLAEVF